MLAGIAILGWLIHESVKPLPGEKIAYDCSSYADFSKLGTTNTDDKCRIHVPMETAVKYATNPPVFGPHDPEWTKAGVYDQLQSDRNTTHSLEHGYVIMYYKCGLKSEQGNKEATSSPQLDFNSDCQVKKSQLEAIYNKKGKHKLIVVPRANLETDFALTAWGYLDKFNGFNERRITSFINAHLDNGPEHTMEP